MLRRFEAMVEGEFEVGEENVLPRTVDELATKRC